MKSKIEEINLILNTIHVMEKPILGQETIDRINQIIRRKTEDKQIEQRRIEAIKEKDRMVNDCLRLLLKSGDNGVPIEEMSKYVSTNFSGLIIKLKNLIKERGGLWVLKKKTMQGKIYYIMKTSV